MTAQSRNTAGTPPATAACGCCKGRSRVPDIVGELRPCSRCRPHEEFSAWYAARRAAESGEQ